MAIAVFHYMGCSTFSNFTVLPEIALAKVREDAPFDKICYIGCGVTTGIGAVIYTAKVWPGANVAVFGLGGIGLNVIQGARMVGADKIIGIDLNPGQARHGREVRHDAFHQPGRGRPRQGGAGDRRPHRRRRRLLLRVHRQRRTSCARRWNAAIAAGARASSSASPASGQEIATRPFQLVTGRVWRGTAFGGARGRTDVPKIVDWYMEGKINIDDLITHTMPLDEINDGLRPDARRQVDPLGRGVLSATSTPRRSG